MKVSAPVLTNILVEELSLPGSDPNIVSKVNFNKETKVLISELHKSQNWFYRICFENTTVKYFPWELQIKQASLPCGCSYRFI